MKAADEWKLRLSLTKDAASPRIEVEVRQREWRQLGYRIAPLISLPERY